MNKKIFLGIILVIMGLFWTLSNFQLIRGSWFLPIIGFAFLAAYLYRREDKLNRTPGFLIAGCIIIMVGLFNIINESVKLGLLEGPLFFYLLGISFLPVYFIHTRNFAQQDSKQHKWPLYTGFSIIGFGILVLIIEAANTSLIRRFYPIILPIILILLGCYVIFFYKRKED
ncbi:MAG TPA: hypothetical protein PLT58_00095 [Atribacterota bacterium]|nr:hypothetical protein [Atribacterota bacterium]HOR41558.1 hypothetical protein [Atribacterota bacterium]HPK87081.1 hypothetical protein [Atribacterota bacterium]